MQISLSPRWRSIVFFAMLVLLGAGWVAETVRIALLETWTESNRIADLERARTLDANDPELYYRTGTLYLLGVDASSSDPLPWFHKATELNPKIAKYWLGLGRACFVAQDQSCADQAFERAVQLSPMTPSTQWEAATYYALTGRPDMSFARLRRLLHFDPERENEIFEFTWRAFDPSATWQRVIAMLPDTRVKCDYLAFLAENHRSDLASDYWTQAAALVPPPSFEDVKPYLKQLLQADQYTEAARVWEELLHRGIIRRTEEQDQGNLIFNGSFEQPILNAGFDWHALSGNFVTVDFSDPSAHTGKHALRIDYTVPHNSESDAAYQLIPVAPNEQYVLTAFARSDELTSDSGPRLRVKDPQCSACVDVATPMTVGTTPWHQLRLAFSTGSKTQVLRLSVWRPRGRTFPMDIGGSFWLDSVSLHVDGPVLPSDARSGVASNLP